MASGLSWTSGTESSTCIIRPAEALATEICPAIILSIKTGNMVLNK